MARLFGTDGVRGRANADLTAELALDLAVAAAHVLGEAGVFEGRRPFAVVGRDTRASGEFLEAAVVAGLASELTPEPTVVHEVHRRGPYLLNFDALEGTANLDVDASIAWLTNPPSSGPHFDVWTRWGSWRRIVRMSCHCRRGRQGLPKSAGASASAD